MIRVGGRALEPVHKQFLERDHVRSKFGLAPGNADFLRLCQQSVTCVGRLPPGGAGKLLFGVAGVAGGVLVEFPGLLEVGPGIAQEALDAVGIEVHVGYRGEKRLHDKHVDVAVMDAEPGGPVRVHRNALGGMHQQILQRGHFRILTADTHALARFTLGRLFTLVAEHIHRRSPSLPEALLLPNMRAF